jgi:transcriptional regulator with XRE-family HTH domain
MGGTRTPERGSSRLARWREENDRTLTEVGDLSGLSAAFLSRLERGHRRARPETKIRLARALGVRVAALFDVDQYEEPDEPANRA